VNYLNPIPARSVRGSTAPSKSLIKKRDISQSLSTFQSGSLEFKLYVDPECTICRYYSRWDNPEYRFIQSSERWEYARDECQITICVNHHTLFLLRDKRRMVYTDNVGEASRVGRPTLPTFFCNITGQVIHRESRGNRRYWKLCFNRLTNRKGQ